MKRGEQKAGARIAPATFKEVIQLARQANTITSDDGWIGDVEMSGNLRSLVHDLDMAIICLPLDSGEDLVRRLARAEAERLRGSLLNFEHRVVRHRQSISDDEALRAGEELNVAISTFLALADRLE